MPKFEVKNRIFLFANELFVQSATHLPNGSRATFLFLRHIFKSSVIYYWIDAQQHGIHLLNPGSQITPSTAWWKQQRIECLPWRPAFDINSSKHCKWKRETKQISKLRKLNVLSPILKLVMLRNWPPKVEFLQEPLFDVHIIRFKPMRF